VRKIVIQKPVAKIPTKFAPGTPPAAYVVKSDAEIGQTLPAGVNCGRKSTASRANAQIKESGGQKM
jgi:hypothetical protein